MPFVLAVQPPADPPAVGTVWFAIGKRGLLARRDSSGGRERWALPDEAAFRALGIPHQRGFVYTIAVVNRGGEDGRLVIDARTGRILRFMPASRWGGNYEEEAPPPPTYGPQSALPPPTVIRGGPRPPASVPRVASQTVPMPKPAPLTIARPNPPPRNCCSMPPAPC